ncbi:MAG: hypothetical protein GVY28_10845, partial [Alphaproteobacteria bacterium]|nr:hypothetical protein [Alphaproteobacteria bacterium]
MSRLPPGSAVPLVPSGPGRRRVLLGAAGLVFAGLPVARTAAQAVEPEPAPTQLDTALMSRAADQAAGLDQLHSLVIARGGEIALAE